MAGWQVRGCRCRLRCCECRFSNRQEGFWKNSLKSHAAQCLLSALPRALSLCDYRHNDFALTFQTTIPPSSVSPWKGSFSMSTEGKGSAQSQETQNAHLYRYIEGIVRGYRNTLLTGQNYSNLTQCETIDGTCGPLNMDSTLLMAYRCQATALARLWRLPCLSAA